MLVKTLLVQLKTPKSNTKGPSKRHCYDTEGGVF